MVSRRCRSHRAVQEERQHKATPRSRHYVACLRFGEAACLLASALPGYWFDHLSRVALKGACMVFRPISREGELRSTSPLRFMRRQHLSYIRLGNPKLSRNTGWRDASLEGCTNSTHLTARQRDFADVHGSSLGVVLCGRPFHRQVRSDV
jgi:hypothetical protein